MNLSLFKIVYSMEYYFGVPRSIKSRAARSGDLFHVGKLGGGFASPQLTRERADPNSPKLSSRGEFRAKGRLIRFRNARSLSVFSGHVACTLGLV